MNRIARLAAATMAATVAAVLSTWSGTAAAPGVHRHRNREGKRHGRARRALEPPRSCPDCARRMVVQVTPIGLDGAVQQHSERRSD